MGPKYREQTKINWNQNFKIIMDSVEDYAHKWAKEEDEPVECLSEWIKSIRSALIGRIHQLRKTTYEYKKPILSQPFVRRNLQELHDKFVIVPTDKASNNITIICKQHYINCLRKELGTSGSMASATYKATDVSQEDICDKHKTFMSTHGLFLKKDDMTIPSLYWIPKPHKDPYKERYIAGSSKCTTKPLSKLLTIVLTTVKQGLERYC